MGQIPRSTERILVLLQVVRIVCCQSDDGFARSLLSVLYGSYRLSVDDVILAPPPLIRRLSARRLTRRILQSGGD